MALPNNCPLCKSESGKQSVVTSHVYGAKKDRNCAFFHCEVCDIRYQYPGLSKFEESQFYAAEFESFMASRSGNSGGWFAAEDHISANEPTRLRRLKYLDPYLNKPGRVLELGCSSGFMLLPLSKAGWDCIGVEPSGVFGSFVSSRGLKVYESIDDLEMTETKLSFDLIMHFFVLEHIADPVTFLMRQLAMLKSGGKLIFEIPNAADPLYTVYDIPEFERFYWSIAHPWYFSERSLHYLLDKICQPYQVVRDQRYDLSNHIIWARDGKPGGMGYFNEILGDEFEGAYKKALITSGKCDTLVAIIEKD